MWSWRCSACPRVFYGETAGEAESKFQKHAREDHNARVVLSLNTEEKKADG